MDRDVRVGVILPLKKTRSGRMQELFQSQALGVQFIHIDPELVDSVESLIDKYGRLDAILHKLAHDMVFERLGDATAAKNMKIMHEYIKMNPQVAVIDPLESVQVLTNREAVCSMLSKITGTLFCLPRYTVINSTETKAALVSEIHRGEFPLPVIAKSVEACGTDASHVMKVIAKIEDIEAIDVDSPVMLHEYINHGGRLFKGYVLGDTITVAERRSLPDLVAPMPVVEFDTQKPYPTASSFAQDPSQTNPSSLSTPSLEADVIAIGRAIQKQAKLTLFGFDVIRSSQTHELMVVDVNYFPSYKELETFDHLLRKHILHTIT
ncbi:hypothetical protein Ae201684P_007269 [Aphanomyces euteiches]|nr:hypothetical protein Ae201684P_007269 [Aphanomyces euteiches]KAH9132057.1 hypothetical protein AeRB84_021419 [Aphanomyces euteiches]